MMLRILLACLVLLASTDAWAEIGHKLTFESRWQGKPFDVTAHLSYPDTKSDRYPAMIIVPSSGSLHDRDWENAEMLNKMGVATLVVDSQGSRGIKDLYKDKQQFTDLDQARDVEAAIRYLARQPNIDTLRIGSMGRSQGGQSSMHVAMLDWREKNQVRSPRLALVVGIYSGCITTREDASIVSPIVFLLAGKDDLTPPGYCVEFAERMRAAGGIVEWIVYPDLVHSFDVRATPLWSSQQENYAKCRSVIPKQAGLGLIRVDTNQLLQGDAIGRYLRDCRTMGGMVGGGGPGASKQMDEDIAAAVRKYLLRN